MATAAIHQAHDQVGTAAGRQRRRFLSMGGVLAAATGLALLADVAVMAGARHPVRALAVGPSGHPALDGWFRYDAGWYDSIVRFGYAYTPGRQSSIAFFPAYPLAVRGVAALTGSVPLAGVMLTLTCGLVSALLFYQWASRMVPGPTAIVATVGTGLLLLYPFSLYLYGAFYPDALFLACSLAAFLLLEGRHLWLAGLVGAVASATRPVGIALVIGLVIRAVELRVADRRGGDRRQPVTVRELLTGLAAVRPADAGVLLAGSGLAAYCLYLYTRFGDPVAFATVQKAPGWDQGSGLKVLLKANWVYAELFGPWSSKLQLGGAAMAVLAALLLLPRVRRLLGLGYAALVLVAIAIPVLGTKDFLGSGRYMLAAFPCFLAAGHLLAGWRSVWARVAVLTTGALGLAVASFFYGAGFEVS